MALLPFRYDRETAPYLRRRTVEGTVVDPGFIANGVTADPQLRLPADIDPNYVPDDPPSVAPQEPPVIDPKLLAAVQPPRTVSSDATTPTALSAMPEPPPPPVWDPIITDKSGRPKVSPTAKGDPSHILEKQREAVERYEPKAEPKWKRFLRIALGTGAVFAGAAAHDPRAVAMAAEGLGRNIGNGKWPDENWKREQQAEIGKRQDENLDRRKTEAQISEMGMVPMVVNGQTVMVPRKQVGSLAIRQKGVDVRGQRVSDQKISDGLARYNALKDYDPSDPKHAGLKRIFEETYGLPDLPAKNDDKWQIRMVNGEYELIPTKPGQEAVTVTKDGEALVDPGKVADQSVTLPNGTVLDNLTPKEKAIMEGRAYEGAQNRQSREKIAAASQAGQDRRKAMGGGAMNTSVKGAVSALSRFRSLTSNIEKQKVMYGADSPVVKASYEERDAYAANMKKIYGNLLELDTNGNPSGLRDDAVASPESSADLTGQSRSVSAWRKKYPKASAEQEAKWKAKVEAAGGSVVK